MIIANIVKFSAIFKLRNCLTPNSTAFLYVDNGGIFGEFIYLPLKTILVVVEERLHFVKENDLTAIICKFKR
jgi:hypothetical protein